MKRFYIIFLVFAIIIFLLSAFLFINLNKAIKDINNIILKEIVKETYNFSKKYEENILKILPKNQNWVKYLKSHPDIQKYIEEELSLISINDVEYIYLLGKENDKYVFLADASKKDKACFEESFYPLNKEEFKKLKPHYFFHYKLKSLFLTYIYPIVVNGKIKALIVIDYSLELSKFIKNILNKLIFNIRIVLIIAFFMFFVLIFISFIDYKREKEKEELLNQLKKVNEELEINVKKKIEEIRKKDAIILNQSKLASLGEMLNMIAHQWRQPLNSLSASAITIELKSEMNQLKEEECKNFARYVQNQTQQLSEIIDDFMNFSKPDREKEEFLLKNLIEDIMKIVGVQLKNRNIKVDIDIDENLKLNSYKKELSHVLLNLISNARDALESKKNGKIIKISSSEDENYVYLIIEDNAGGIPEEIKDRIFEPYFTTKGPKGIGLGLYMSKKITEERLNGTIDFENTKSGAKFIVKLKKEKR